MKASPKVYAIVLTSLISYLWGILVLYAGYDKYCIPAGLLAFIFVWNILRTTAKRMGVPWE